MAKNNQKKEKALRNQEYARKFRKKTTRRRSSGSGPASGGSGKPGFSRPAGAPAGTRDSE